VQLIGEKLIAPALGAIVVTCAVALAGTAAASSTGSSPAPATPAAAASGPTGAGVVASSIRTRNVLVGRRVTVSGALESTTGLGTVILQEQVGSDWTVVARAGDIAGTFRLAFRPRHLGVHAIRLLVAGSDTALAVPVASLDVFHRVLASWYGPGGRTACGQELTAHTLGVANKTLPCGTRVTLHYRRHTLRVPVIDRGPYVAGRDYDLTWATKQALGAHDLTEVWANR
jgi:hypothetical protein